MAMDNYASKVFELGARKELQLEGKADSQVFLELKEGSAEIFGTELVQNKQYLLPQSTYIAVFTWDGCTLKVSESTKFACVSANDLMDDYKRVHDFLEQLRQEAEDNELKGPTLLVCGPTFVGKSTACRILLNYAVRAGRNPVFADLDVNQGQIALPGTIGAAFVANVADVGENFSYEPSYVYHYGHTSPGDDMDLYISLISCLAEDVSIRAENNDQNYISGIIIDTCGWLPGDERQSIKHAVDAFDVNVILVIDQPRLHCEFTKKLPDGVCVFRAEKTTKKVIRSDQENRKAQDNIIRGYFYGLKEHCFPHSISIKFSNIEVLNIRDTWLTCYCLPPGTAHDTHARLLPIPIGTHLQHRVLSVMLPSNVEDCFYELVRGFACVIDVNMKNQTLTILYRKPEFPLGAILLMSDVKYERQL